MKFQQKRTATSRAEDFAALIVRFREGESACSEALGQLLLPGVRLLIQRRTGRCDVDAEAKSLLNAAMANILGQPSLEAAEVPEMVRKMIHEAFPVLKGHNSQAALASNHELHRGTKIAERILKRMPAVVQDALRRSYVLGEPPEAILAELGLTPDRLRDAKSKARADFAAKMRQPRAGAA